MAISSLQSKKRCLATWVPCPSSAPRSACFAAHLRLYVPRAARSLGSPDHSMLFQPKCWVVFLFVLIAVAGPCLLVSSSKSSLLFKLARYPSRRLGELGDTAVTLAVEGKTDSESTITSILSHQDAPQQPPGFPRQSGRIYSPGTAFNVASEAAAAVGAATAASQHHVAPGHHQQRLYVELPTTFSYVATWGLCNQLFTHLSLLAIASAFNATLVLPPAASRDTFDGRPEFREEPLDTLLDVDRMADHWRPRGLRIVKAAETEACTRLDVPRRPNGLGTDMRPISDIINSLAVNISALAKPTVHSPTGVPPCVLVDYGFPWQTVLPRFTQSVPYINQAARGLFFAPSLLKKTDAVVAAMEAAGHVPFLGVHLRIESDWSTVYTMDKGQDVLGLYIKHMKRAGFKPTSAVYAASGIFSYANGTEVERVKGRLAAAGVCGTLLYKEMLLPQEDFQGLHSEQLALVDLLVLTRAQKLVGDGRSSFAGFANQYRVLQGQLKDSFYNIQPLFNPFIFTRRRRLQQQQAG